MDLIRGGRSLLAGTIGRLLFPPVCAGCSGAVERNAAVCPTCWRRLSFIERPYCEVLGLPFSYDLGRGFLCAEAIADPPPFGRLRAAVLYGDVARRFVSALKYRDRTDLVPLMAAWMQRAGEELLRDADLVVPVPLHFGRLWRRRFNQSAELARAIVAIEARAGHRLALAPLALQRLRPTRSQVGLSRNEREDNLRGAFGVPDARRGEVAGKRVLLIDDVFTTGATASSATRALRRAGAANVDVLAFARVAAGAPESHMLPQTTASSKRWPM